MLPAFSVVHPGFVQEQRRRLLLAWMRRAGHPVSFSHYLPEEEEPADAVMDAAYPSRGESFGPRDHSSRPWLLLVPHLWGAISRTHGYHRRLSLNLELNTSVSM